MGAFRQRTLSLDPTRTGFCFAVFEGSERLIDYGCAQLEDRSERGYLTRVEALISWYSPRFLVLEGMVGSRRGVRASVLLATIERHARGKGLAVVRITRAEVREEFRAVGWSKYQIAVGIARLFPELEPRLPRKRKAWMTEDERMNIFDAVSFALVALRRPAPEE